MYATTVSTGDGDGQKPMAQILRVGTVGIVFFWFNQGLLYAGFCGFMAVPTHRNMLVSIIHDSDLVFMEL